MVRTLPRQTIPRSKNNTRRTTHTAHGRNSNSTVALSYAHPCAPRCVTLHSSAAGSNSSEANECFISKMRQMGYRKGAAATRLERQRHRKCGWMLHSLRTASQHHVSQTYHGYFHVVERVLLLVPSVRPVLLAGVQVQVQFLKGGQAFTSSEDAKITARRVSALVGGGLKQYPTAAAKYHVRREAGGRVRASGSRVLSRCSSKQVARVFCG